jgi:periplasmic protein TonB
MPHDLFGDVAVRRAPRSRVRRVLTILSIALHAIVIAAIVVVQLFAVGELPVPRRPLMFEEVQLVRVADIPAPPAPRRAASDPTPAVDPNAAPTVEPRGIADETGIEGLRTTPQPTGAVIGVEHGTGSLDAIGVVERVAPPPPAGPPPPVHLHSGMQAPVKIVNVEPVYPAIAQTARVQGVVILEAIIDERGAVKSVSVLRSIPLLDRAAEDAVRQWRFTPARLNGESVPVVMTVTINFHLDR